ncbi:hypothetical protein [Corynebacterium flavescens]|uniref:hypothetical protein n=1 Tax=Corynebacterium flavescens TaxID=28028 RepID=UPI003FD5BF2A
MTSTDHFTAATATASANATAARTVPGATLRRNRARHFGDCHDDPRSRDGHHHPGGRCG